MTLDEVIKYLEPRVEIVGDCWEWTLALADGVTPMMRVPKVGTNVSVRRMILRAKGVNVEGKDSVSTCGNPLCVNPDHAAAWTRSKTMKRIAQRPGYHQAITRNAAISKAKRAKAAKLTIEIAREIRNDPCNQRQAAAKYGVCQHTIWSIRTHRTWKEYADNPFNGLGARNT